jgi:hypothetical protein
MLIALNIGGYSLHLYGPDHLSCLAWPLQPFEQFLQPSQTIKVDITAVIEVCPHLPTLHRKGLRYDALEGLWQLYDGQNDYVFESADPLTAVTRTCATISLDYSRVHVWTLQHSSILGEGWLPMQVINPLLEVCLLTKLGRDGGWLMHAAGVHSKADGFVFTGASGAGKSTLSEWFSLHGAQVFSDERVIIKQTLGHFMFWGTPWPGSGRHSQNRMAPLTQVFCIRHAQTAHHIHRSSQRNLCQHLMSQSFLPMWDRQALTNVVSSMGELIESNLGCELAFLNQADVVAYVQTHARRLHSPHV